MLSVAMPGTVDGQDDPAIVEDRHVGGQRIQRGLQKFPLPDRGAMNLVAIRDIAEEHARPLRRGIDAVIDVAAGASAASKAGS